jgi:hypothetical protein
VRPVGVYGVQSPLGAELAQPTGQGIGAPLQHGWSRPQDSEDGMILYFAFHKFFILTCYNVGFYVTQEKYWGRSPLLGCLATCT